MSRSYVRLVTFVFAASGLMPLVVALASRYGREKAFPWHAVPTYTLLTLGVLCLSVGLWAVLAKLEVRLDQASSEQAEFIRTLPDRYVSLAIFGSAGLSLFLELSVIRWQATVFPLLAFYKNLSMLACFAGLGLGYAMGRRNHVPLFLTVPMFCWQFVVMIGVRYGLTAAQWNSLYVIPFREQLNMGLGIASHLYNGLQTYFVLSVVFLLTALAFVPIGQLCGSLMERREKLPAYGLNLLGSLAGVLLTFVGSTFWTPPTIWFLVSFAGLMLFYVRKRSILLWGAAGVVLALTILDWPVDPAWHRIYSPYQLLEVGHRDDNGLMLIRAAGHYYQRVIDLSLTNQSDPMASRARLYYDLPYRTVNHLENVAIVGAGSGNDVAAALRAGAVHVDAVEIDPAILMLGKVAHPEHPYSDPRVHAIADDARSFLRGTNQHFDLIVYGLLDSHTLLSQASSVRLDSFVYTVQALREARARLKPHGVISLAFAVINDRLGRKIFQMMQQAFDGKPPQCIKAGYDGGVIFLESEDPQPPVTSASLSQTGFQDKTAFYANPAIHADVSTDDWPFFYMPERVYPLSYLVVIALILVLSVFLFTSFLGEKPSLGNFPFFLLGAGFMLVETKGITELGLTFGNSWQVIGVVIAAIMVMAFVANCLVQWLDIKRTLLPYLLLFATLACGWWIARAGGLPSTWLGRAGTALILTSPMFFSGMVFSTLLRSQGEISGMMAMNLFGTMCGGLLEYNSMYFGFQFLYLIAGSLYFVALMWGAVRYHAESVVLRTEPG
jgi:spermidine synthase